MGCDQAALSLTADEHATLAVREANVEDINMEAVGFYLSEEAIVEW